MYSTQSDLAFAQLPCSVYSQFDLADSQKLSNCHVGYTANSTWPLINLDLVDKSGNSLCSLGLTATDTDNNNNLIHVTALYQNNVKCLAGLSNTSSLQFSLPSGSDSSSFCLGGLELLPSMLAVKGQ